MDKVDELRKFHNVMGQGATSEKCWEGGTQRGIVDEEAAIVQRSLRGTAFFCTEGGGGGRSDGRGGRRGRGGGKRPTEETYGRRNTVMLLMDVLAEDSGGRAERVALGTVTTAATLLSPASASR
jgi:hypothetical protein